MIISTYNAATYLETMSMNIPTIIYWDPMQWELRDSVKEIFEELKRVNVFVNNYSDLLKTLNYAKRIGYQNWWNEPERKIVINTFCNRFAILPNSYSKKFIQSINYYGL